MDKFRTEVEINKPNTLIQYSDPLFFIGSCFANNIGNYFKDSCLNTLVNPFGVLYNPSSIAQALRRIIQNKHFTENDIYSYDGQYHTFFHHSQFNDSNKERYLNTVNKELLSSSEFLKTTKHLVITFGTSWVYQHKKMNSIVANCHKYKADEFNRFRLSPEEIYADYKVLITELKRFNPSLQILLTVSPVRHWKDGAHGNQLSKASLLLAIEKLTSEFDHVDYFPAYELILDELRDYRFFADDMLHPTPLAVKFVRNRFRETWFDSEANKILDRINKLQKAADHRPFSIQSESHQKFIANSIRKVDELAKELKELDLSELKQAFEKQKC